MIKLLYFVIFVAIKACIYKNCSSNCLCCQSSQICTQCFKGYIMYDNLTCSTCKCFASNCLNCNCNNPYLCLNCEQGYRWDVISYSCINNNNTQDSAGDIFSKNLLIVIVSSIGSVALLILIIFSLLYLRKYFKRKSSIIVPHIQNQIIYQLSISASSTHNSFSLARKSNSSNTGSKDIDNQITKNQSQLMIIDLDFVYNTERDGCAICLSSNCNTITRCKHYFHLQCLRSWIKKNKNCPICKKKDINVIDFVTCMECKNKTKLMNIFSKAPQSKCQKNHFQSQHALKANESSYRDE